MSRASHTPTAYVVVCPQHGRQHLTPPEYKRQLDRGTWACPACHGPARFDRSHFTRALDKLAERER